MFFKITSNPFGSNSVAKIIKLVGIAKIISKKFSLI